MSATNFAWLAAATGWLTILLYLAAAVFLCTRWSRFPRPTRWALSAFALFLSSQIGMRVVLIVLAQATNVGNFMLYNVLITLLGSLMHFAGLCVLITAVYVDRNPKATEDSETHQVGRTRSRDSDSNPYAV